MQKVIYFTATNIPTTEELAEIAALNTRAQAPLEIAVRNAEANNNFGTGPEAADYVMGTRPTAYADEEDFPALPALPDPDTTALVTDGDELEVTGGTVTLSVVEGVLSAEFTATP